MIFSRLHKSAIKQALKFGLSFALYRDKDSDKLIFVCDDNSDRKPLSSSYFYAVNWLDKFANRTLIADKLTLDEVANYDSDANYQLAESWAESTNKDEYIIAVSNLINELKQTNGKTVISRAIAVNFNKDIADVAEDYFAANRNTYCCLIHTPQIGCWLIASPEILIEANFSTRQLQTVALAGTRLAGSKEQWDSKNIYEQKMVCDFITQTFNNLNLQYNVSECLSVKTNNIEHIATYVAATLKDINGIPNIADMLSPTPALCGIPRETSIARIADIEKHPRRLYGGYFGFVDDQQLKAIVTLRCAQLSHNKACIYAGGGITNGSNAELEWEETTLKSQILSNILTK